MSDQNMSEANRLESLWAGNFGDDYSKRNIDAGEGRGPFWHMLLSEYPIKSILEVGCNVGPNLGWIAKEMPEHLITGVDINLQALAELRQRMPGINTLHSTARSLPFRDRWFDMVFTTGVLIHQPPETLPLVMAEIVRCSKRYVLCGEYEANEPTEVPYRGHRGALFKRNFGGLYQELFPELTLRKTGFLPRAEGGWDDLTYWLFERSE